MSTGREQKIPTDASCSVQMANARYVGTQEFLRLALSRRKLVRFDPAEAEYRGLLDIETGARYLMDRR